MENEAASVEDEGWARETRQHVSLLRQHAFVVDCLLAVLALSVLSAFWLCGWVLFLRYAWHMDQNVVGGWFNVNKVRFDLLMVGILILLGLALGLRGIKPKYAALTLAALPLLLWLIGKLVYVEGVWDDPTVKFDQHFTADFVEYPLRLDRLLTAAGCALFGFLGAWAGNGVRRKRALPHRNMTPCRTLPKP